MPASAPSPPDARRSQQLQPTPQGPCPLPASHLLPFAVPGSRIERCSEFPYPHLPRSLSPPDGTFAAVDATTSTGHRRPESVADVRITLGVVPPVGWTSVHHHSVTQSVSSALKTLRAPPAPPSRPFPCRPWTSRHLGFVPDGMPSESHSVQPPGWAQSPVSKVPPCLFVA